MSEGNDLPSGWVWAPLADFCDVEMGQSPPSSTYNSEGLGLPFFQGKAEFSELHPVAKLWCSNPSKIANPGDVLLSVRAPVGPTNMADVRCCIGRGLAGLSPTGGVLSKYVMYAIRHRASELDSLGTGTTFKAVSGGVVRSFKLPLAPVAEQERVVAKVDELLSDLDAGVAALARARANLKKYRAAVLKAAVTGDLTADWRAAHPNVEPATKLLDRILVERRRKWAAEQQTKFAKRGKVAANGWQSKYPEPIELDSAGLPELPSGWCWTTLDSLAELAGGITKGQKRKSDDRPRQVAYLRVANVQRGYLDLSEMKTIEATDEEIAELRLKPGDILFNEGGDRDKLGRGWVWRGEFDECIHQNHVFRARPLTNEVEPEFVSHHGNTFGQEWFSRAGKQSVNLASINLTVLRRFPVPLPPTAEQRVIISALQEQLSDIDATENYIDASLNRAGRLRQSILKEAFAGRLVPQDPRDEPASVLLTHIRKARSGGNNTTTLRKSRRPLDSRSRVHSETPEAEGDGS